MVWEKQKRTNGHHRPGRRPRKHRSKIWASEYSPAEDAHGCRYTKNTGPAAQRRCRASVSPFGSGRTGL